MIAPVREEDAFREDGKNPFQEDALNLTRQQAIEYMRTYDPKMISWTPKRELEIVIARPASSVSYFPTEVARLPVVAGLLAGGKPINIERKVINDAACMVCTGEGAAEAARALRDEAKLNFPRCASIPEGPGKSA